MATLHKFHFQCAKCTRGVVESDGYSPSTRRRCSSGISSAMLVRSSSAHPSGCWNGPWKDAPLAVGGPASPSIAGRASGPVLTTLTPSCGPGHAHSTLLISVPIKRACRCVSVPAPGWALSSHVCRRQRRLRLPAPVGSTKSSTTASASWRGAMGPVSG
jgi:hypothetical protein